MRITYIGGPTALIEFGGLRLLTDPTFDPAGSTYPTPVYTLYKTQSPALAAETVQPVDAVLLSHDHHFDNLDHGGRACIATAGSTYTTHAGAERLGSPATGLSPWESAVLTSPQGGSVRITATPARHGPAGGDRGPVIGFLLEFEPRTEPVVYVSGDTVWFDGVAEVGERVHVDVAILNLGAAKVAVAGPSALTFTAAEAVTLARAWPHTKIVPLHFEGWTHFTEGHDKITAAFEMSSLASRLVWLPPGQPTIVP